MNSILVISPRPIGVSIFVTFGDGYGICLVELKWKCPKNNTAQGELATVQNVAAEETTSLCETMSP